MKKILMLVALAALFALSCVGLVACGGDEGEGTKYKVTYYDADQTTVLKTEEVAEGGKATEWTPEDKADAEFLDWYATPDYAFEFDFNAAITKDTPVYSMWSSFEEDTRTWMIAGNFQGADLKNNNWGEDGRLHPEKYAFEPVEGELNTFTLTVDLYEGDVFQFGVFDYEEKPGGTSYERTWLNQKGFGLLENPGENFIDKGNYLASEVNKHDIGVGIDGTYEFTMKTDVNDDNIGTIAWERVADAPALEVAFTPSIYGSFNNFTNGANIAPEYMMEQADDDGLVWEVTASMNYGDFMVVLPFNNYNAQVTSGALTKGSDAVSKPGGYEIMFTETAKYSIQLTITETQDEENPYTYAATVDKIGDYEVGDNEDKYTVTYGSGEGTNYTIYLKNGARYPYFAEPTLAAGETLMGWHFAKAGADGEDVGIEEENTYAAKGVQDGVISYGVTKEGVRDTREFWIKGTGGTANGKPLSWAGGDENVYFNQTGDHEYTATLVLNGEQKEMQVCEDYLGVKTDTYLRKGSIVDHDKLDFIDPEGLSNIRFSQNGTYILTLNSLTMKITVVRTGDAPAATPAE